MTLFGLTGGIGTGKSTLALGLMGRGVPVVDTDNVARELVAPGQPANLQIRARFGPEVFDADNRLQREKLGELIFRDLAARVALEEILHPLIRATWQRVVSGWREGGIHCGVVVIPLLFETNAASAFDRIICTACSEGTQAMRLAERGWDAAHVQARLQAQWPLAKKMAASDHVVWSEGPKELLLAQAARIGLPTVN